MGALGALRRDIGDWFRKRRGRPLAAMINRLGRDINRPVRIADVGGSVDFWEPLPIEVPIEVTIINLFDPCADQNIGSMRFHFDRRDARALTGYSDGCFDLAVSNSLIEHLGGWDDIKAGAREIRRIAELGWVQTPAFSFPVDPHFMFPFIHWLPIPVRARVISSLPHGFYYKLKEVLDVEGARRAAEDANLLTYREMAVLFPDAKVHVEKLLFFSKSYVATWPRGAWTWDR